MAGIHRSSTLGRLETVSQRWRWGWPGFTAQVHSGAHCAAMHMSAGDGRDSPLKYTRSLHRHARRVRWGWPGFTAQVHWTRCDATAAIRLGMAGIHRSSTLLDRAGMRDCTLGMAGIHRSSTLAQRASRYADCAGDGRDSPLKYTQQRRGA